MGVIVKAVQGWILFPTKLNFLAILSVSCNQCKLCTEFFFVNSQNSIQIPLSINESTNTSYGSVLFVLQSFLSFVDRKTNRRSFRHPFEFKFWPTSVFCFTFIIIYAILTLKLNGWNVSIAINGLLTHWGGVTHICVSKLITIVSDNGLSPGRRQAIIWTNAGILSIGPLGTNFSEILIEI